MDRPNKTEVVIGIFCYIIVALHTLCSSNHSNYPTYIGGLFFKVSRVCIETCDNHTSNIYWCTCTWHQDLIKLKYGFQLNENWLIFQSVAAINCLIVQKSVQEFSNYKWVQQFSIFSDLLMNQCYNYIIQKASRSQKASTWTVERKRQRNLQN
jgi:hypothetical protein